LRFIEEHQSHRVGDGLRWGVEPICAVLSEHGCPIAPSAYYGARSRPVPARVARDERLKTEIARVHAENYGVYGARKIWLALNCEGIEVARCAVERLMRELGLAGARRGKRHRTSTPRSPSLKGSPPPESSHRSAVSVTPTTTPWPSR
jgi:putative transposase